MLLNVRGFWASHGRGASMIAMARCAASLFMTDFSECSNLAWDARRLSKYQHLDGKGRRH
jgi:hypothetical protein